MLDQESSGTAYTWGKPPQPPAPEDTVKALVTTAPAPLTLELRSVPDPRPRPDEVLVEVHATALNRADLLLAARRPAGSPLGLDVVGTVLRPASDGTGPAAGARVTGLAANNAWAELAAVRADRLTVIPDGVTDTDAVTLPVAGLTALYALRRAGWLLGKHALVTGASGGVGRTAVQLARAGGSEVTAWVGSAARGKGLADLGAQVVTGYDEPPTAPVDILVDSVGGDVFSTGYGLLRPGGVATVFGNTVRAELRLPADWGHARPGVRIEYLYLLDEVTRRDVPADLALLLDLVVAGKLTASPGLLTPWTDPQRAIDALYSREVNGRIVLSM
ncbi:zinc-binding dehydrogenase [Kitasatospora sp. NBC_01539]|uniref:zinc-binding dehydrogenase n=1 Tax=Kitasatospora sp. NBC_01539 TaxID=2903577 RepID=UPI0038602AB3